MDIRKVLIISYLLASYNLFAGTAIVISKPNCIWTIAWNNHHHIAKKNAMNNCIKRGCKKPRIVKYFSGKGYTAIATNDSSYDCRYGYAFNYSSKYKAKQVALNHCEKNNKGAVCQIRFIKFINSDNRGIR